MSKAKIMVVEDEWFIAENIKSNLEQFKYSVTSIESTGEEAVENASIQKPDLVLMDIKLKGEMDGITAAAIIKNRFNIPHVFLTSHSDKKMIERAKKTEPFGYLMKPFDSKELGAVIDIALCKYKSEEKIKEAQEEIRKAHDFLKNVINGVALPIMVIDNDFNVILRNHIAEKYSKDSSLTKCYQISHGKSSACAGAEHPCPLEIVRKTNKPVSLVHEHLTSEGNPAFIEILASPLMGSEGKIIGIIETMRDITEKKRSEMELKEYYQKLEESNSLKNLYADILHHDLLNPLNVLIMSTDLLKDSGDFSEEAQENIAMIEKKSKELMDLIKIATKYTFLEDKSEIDFQQNDILSILENSINELKPFAQKEDTEVNLETEVSKFTSVSKVTSGDFIIPCNELVKDAFSNLLSNAIKYSPRQTEVKIGVVDESDCLKIYFKDRGEGIPDKFKKTIFTRFTRKAREGVRGSGLGLAIVQKIIDLHNGKIRVEDNPEGGSVFIVSLPKKR